MQWYGPGCQEGDVSYGKEVYLANHLNDSGVYSEIDNFVAGRTNGTCDSYDEIIYSPFETSWFIDLGKEYLVDRLQIKINVSENVFNHISVLCRIQLIRLYAYGDNFSARRQCSSADSYYLYRESTSILDCHGTGRFLQLQLYCYLGYHIHLPVCDIAVLGKPEVNINCTNCIQNPELFPCGNGIWCEHCSPGWLPPDCQKPCEVGYYGINCLHKCQHHCSDVPCNAISGLIADPNLCVACDMWYINPQNLCTDYIEKLEQYTNAVTEVDVCLTNITVFVSHDNRISNKVSNYYKYYIEYSVDNFTSYTAVDSHSHTETAAHFAVSFTNIHPSDVELRVRARLFREQNGVKDTGAVPVSVVIPRICSPSFKSDTCQTLTFICSEDCDVDYDNNDELSILYIPSEDTTWVLTPVHPDTCFINLKLHDGGMHEAKLKLVRHQNGVLVKVESNTMIIDVDKCMESINTSSTQDTVIIVVVFLVFFVIAAVVLLIFLCKRGKYYTNVQNMCKKKQPDNVQRDQPGQQYENVSYTAESKNVKMPKNVSRQDNDNAFEYNKAFERSQSLDPKDVKIDEIDNRIYANSEIDATKARDAKQEEDAYLELSSDNCHQQTLCYYESLSRQ